MHKYFSKQNGKSHRGAGSVVRRGALYAAAGLGAGLLNGLLGAAGGILLVAVLPLLPRLSDGVAETRSRRDVLATGMAVMLPVSAVSLVLYFLRGIQPPTSLLSAIWFPSLVGGIIGAWLLDRLPVRAVRVLFSLLVIVSGIRMVLG